MSDIKTLSIDGVGRIKYYLLEGDEQINSSVEIISLFVEPQHRKQGYSYKLIDMLIKLCKQNNIKYLSIKITKTNKIMYELLTKKGFHVYDKKFLMIKSTNNLKTLMKAFFK